LEKLPIAVPIRNIKMGRRKSSPLVIFIR
jgi:hypothetical protein